MAQAKYGQGMARPLHRLSSLKIRRLKTKGMYADGGGLYLRVADGGSKGWVFRYTVNGRPRDMGLGSIHAVSLADAREVAAECRKLRHQDIDPIERRRSEKAARRGAGVKAMTFRQCAEAYIASHAAKWSAKHRVQWPRTLAAYAYPVLGDLPVQAIDTALVMRAIQPAWTTKPATLGRVRGRIEAILDWAKAVGLRHGENPARWRGHLDHLLPARSELVPIKHHAALPYADVGSFMAKLRRYDSMAARALEFAALTAARMGEVLGAVWDEIDFANRVWTIPAGRTKARREHRVPLSPAALEVLKATKAIRHSDYVFPGMREGRPVGQISVLMLAKQVAGADITAHGLRSTFRDWASERTSFPREVAEMALAHAIPNAVEAAYRRGDLFEKRRRLMDAWADFCTNPAASGKVLSMRR